jgi:hypothetical protein
MGVNEKREVNRLKTAWPVLCTEKEKDVYRGVFFEARRQCNMCDVICK